MTPRITFKREPRETGLAREGVLMATNKKDGNTHDVFIDVYDDAVEKLRSAEEAKAMTTKLEMAVTRRHRLLCLLAAVLGEES